jgi:UDP-glucuronate 4-epimerase
LGKGSGTSLRDFINLVQKHVGKKAHIKVLPDQPGDVPYTCADVSKAEYLLGYKSKVPFEEGIRLTAEWYKTAYAKHEIEVCPETQANGLGRCASMVNLETTAAC